MKLILNSLNYSPELTGIGKYNGEMCPELVNRGVEVTAIVAPPYYPEWEIHQGHSKFLFTQTNIDGVNVIRCPLYVPKNVTTLKRLIHLSTFAVSSGLALLGQLFSKPDVIFVVQPTLFCAPMALIVAKLTGAKSVMHIQDFEVDAMFGLGLGGEGRFKRVARGIESWLMQQFDCVSSISYSMLDNAKSKGVAEQKLMFFPNWADTEFVTPDVDGSVLRAQWGFSADDKVVLYSGNIGHKQGLELVLDAAEAFVNDPNVHDPKVHFVIIGSGAYKATLEAMALAKGLTNLRFMPLQPWELVPQILSMADVHLVVQKRGAADAVLPSKLTNILSAGGHALVTTDTNTELGRIAEKHSGIYTCVEPENVTAFIQALKTCLSQDTRSTNAVARDYAVQYLNRDNVINHFVVELNQLVNNEQVVNIQED